jgi:beta-lactam-binding protein with PASTA domain
MLSSRTYRILLYSLIFLAIFFLTSILAYHMVLKGELVTVPDLIGKTLEEARVALGSKRLSIVQTGIQFDRQWERGRIIFTEPPAGSKLNINGMVKVILSAGREKVITPRLIGEDFTSIGQTLEDAGVVRGLISHVHYARRAAGKIMAQNPQPQEEVGRGTAISILVCEGERGESYLMPDLIGKKGEVVIPWLRSLNFKVEDVRDTYYPGLSSGIIIKQSPHQGYMIQKNYPITLEVSK